MSVAVLRTGGRETVSDPAQMCLVPGDAGHASLLRSEGSCWGVGHRGEEKRPGVWWVNHHQASATSLGPGESTFQEQMTTPPSRSMLSPEKQTLSGSVGAVPETLVGNDTNLHRVGMTFMTRWTPRGQKEGETDHSLQAKESHPLLSHSDASQGTEGKAQSTRGDGTEGRGQCTHLPGHRSHLFPDLSLSASSLLRYITSSSCPLLLIVCFWPFMFAAM